MKESISALKTYKWEGALIAVIAGVIIVLTLVTHLTARTDLEDRFPAAPTAAQGPAAFHPTPDSALVGSPGRPIPPLASGKGSTEDRSAPNPLNPSNPLEVIIGPNAISGQYTLLTATRTPATPTSDKLTLRIRVASHAVADLVTPFQSAMLEVRSPGAEPINPEHPFSSPIPAGNSREEDIVFIIPSNLNLDRAALRIHYYNDQKEIPLSRRIAIHQ